MSNKYIKKIAQELSFLKPEGFTVEGLKKLPVTLVKDFKDDVKQMKKSWRR